MVYKIIDCIHKIIIIFIIWALIQYKDAILPV